MTSPSRINEDELDWDGDLRTYEGVPFTGKAFLMYANGQLEQEATYRDGLKDGLVQEWFPNGQLRSEWHAVHGRGEGNRTQWHEDGKVKCISEHEFGCELKYDEWSDTGELLVSRRLDPHSKQYEYVLHMRNTGKLGTVTNGMKISRKPC
jgi:antitoxin component YwqK of YwqJK toxin-antitoxin module